MFDFTLRAFRQKSLLRLLKNVQDNSPKGPPDGHLGSLLGHLGSPYGHLGSLLGHLGSILASCGPHLGAILGHLAVILGPPRPDKIGQDRVRDIFHRKIAQETSQTLSGPPFFPPRARFFRLPNLILVRFSSNGPSERKGRRYSPQASPIDKTDYIKILYTSRKVHLPLNI